MNTCKTCEHWIKYTKEGRCSVDKIVEDTEQSIENDMMCMERGYFWTGPDFGCVHHRQKNPSEEGKAVNG